MKQIFLILFWLVYFAGGAQILNAYAKVTSVTGGNVLALSNVNIANHTFNVGDQVIVMQMQDDVIGANTTNAATFGNLSAIGNAGNFEIRTITDVNPSSGTPTSMTISPALGNTYNTGANASVQLISFRNMGTNFVTTANITGLAWDGNVGGVVAFYVSGILTLNHRVLADALGFRGGLYSNNNGGPICASAGNTTYILNNNQLGFKGEGIYRNTTNTYNNARGKILNGGGGGNDHNAGGGGGGNYTAGGQGGNGYNNCTAFPGGGLGGIALSAHITASRVFMGGGGGGGQQNNSQNSAGGNGGGIVLIKANILETSTTCGASIRISANGVDAINGGNDGMGGGGAGGTIVVEANTFSINAACPITMRANGGDGGDCTDGASHAGGGGGGQGAVIYPSTIPSTNVTNQTTNGTAGQDNSGGSVSAGAGGGTNGSGVITSGSGPLPVELLYFKVIPHDNRVRLNWLTASEVNNDFFTVERSSNGIDYVAISTQKGSGTKKTPSSYSAYDNLPLHGTGYYRLKQTDFNGVYKYSPIVSLEFSAGLEFLMFPNPVKSGEGLTFIIHNALGKNFTVSISGLTGNEIYSRLVAANSSDEKTEFTLDDLNLQSGVYCLKIQEGINTLVKKLVVQ